MGQNTSKTNLNFTEQEEFVLKKSFELYTTNNLNILPEEMKNSLCHYLKSLHFDNKHMIDLNDWRTAASHLVKLARVEEFFNSQLTFNQINNGNQLVQLLATSFVNLINENLEQSAKLKEPSERFIQYCIKTLSIPKFNLDQNDTKKNANVESKEIVNLEKLATGINNSTILKKIFLVVFGRIFFLQINIKKDELSKILNKSKLLSWEDIFIFTFFIVEEVREGEQRRDNWKLVFDSDRDGMSWTTFQTKIEDIGSTIIVIRDKKNNVFGGFAAAEWKRYPKFFGNSNCFLFRLNPQLTIYQSTNINENFQYFNYGTSQLTNGLGFGGQIDYFGLYIGTDFAKGHSRGHNSTTFDNPPLSEDEDFVIDSVEAWLVQEKERDDRLIEGGKQSVLDDTTNVNFMEMSGN
ncbi:hypothetical protein HDU92_001286 [Lobulomyces angularis]|nr:hypothetical protein HDU92_001286 [Lobulomyces angularis]